MAEIKNQKQKHPPTTLPHDIIENILSRLPVKSLLRFRAVSKQWKATMSDPKFAEINLRQPKNSSSTRNLLAWDADYSRKFHIVKLKNNEFQLLSAIKYPPEEDLDTRTLRYCDGLFLKRYGNLYDKMYVLWNLSTRRYKKFHCPYLIDCCYKTLHGICYDPLVKDYKVVIADMEHYAVFYCRSNKWSEMKEMKEVSRSDVFSIRKGVSLMNGSCYWSVTTKREGGRYEFEIVCFDVRDEKFKKLRLPPDCKEKFESIRLTTVGSHLCLFPGMVCAPMNETVNEIWIMKKVGEDDSSWVEFKVQLSIPCRSVYLLCFAGEDEIILDIDDRKNYILYNQSKETFASIPRRSTGKYYLPVPYVENLLLV